MRKCLIFLVVFLVFCTPRILIEERQFGLAEHVPELGKVIKVDTVKIGIGYVKRVTYQKR